MHHLCTSVPIRRAFVFWRRASPICAHYLWLDKRGRSVGHLHDHYAPRVQRLVLELKGLYTKLAQVLSARPDVLPLVYQRQLACVHDQMPSVPLDTEAVQRELHSLVDIGMDEITIESTAVASASIGQVHRGTLYQNGRNVTIAVKMMHADIQERFRYDFQVFGWLCRLVLPEWKGMLHELRRQILEHEFNYTREAEHLNRVRQNMQELNVVVPRALVWTDRLLVMEWIDGKPLDQCLRQDFAQILGADLADTFLETRKQELTSGQETLLSQQMLDNLGRIQKLQLWNLLRKYRRYAHQLVQVHGHQIFVDGVFNGDPHYGNVLKTSDNKLGLIDYGQTKSLTDDERLALAKVVVALGDPEGPDVVAVYEAMVGLGFRLRRPDPEIMLQYARIFFDSDESTEYQTAQHYFAALMEENKLIEIPDAAGTWMMAWSTLSHPSCSLCCSCQLSISRNALCCWRKASWNCQDVVFLCGTSCGRT